MVQKKTLTKSLRTHENDDIFIKTAQYNHIHLNKKTAPIENPDDYPDYQNTSRFGFIFKIMAFSFFIFLAYAGFNKYWGKNINHAELSSQSSAALNTASATTSAKPLGHIKQLKLATPIFLFLTKAPM